MKTETEKKAVTRKTETRKTETQKTEIRKTETRNAAGKTVGWNLGKLTERKAERQRKAESRRSERTRTKERAGVGRLTKIGGGAKTRVLALSLCLIVFCTLLAGGCGKQEPVTIRVGSLKGPTSMGILSLMDRAEQGQTESLYEFQMATGADELLPLMIKGDLDIALVPANVAAVLYQKMDGGIAVIDINTLGVLYLVTGTAEITSVADLKGKTIYLTGKGTTPEASLKYLLQQNGLKEEDYTLEYKSEATEVAAVLAADPTAIGLLPQPFVTAALMQNESLKVVLDINEEWVKTQNGGGNGMVTGVTVVRRDFLQEHEAMVEEFLREHRESAAAINGDPDQGAALAVKAGIVAKEPIARQAIPQCNITCIEGKEMKQALEAYLAVLADFNAELVGGALPGEDFYFLGEE